MAKVDAGFGFNLKVGLTSMFQLPLNLASKGWD